MKEMKVIFIHKEITEHTLGTNTLDIVLTILCKILINAIKSEMLFPGEL